MKKMLILTLCLMSFGIWADSEKVIAKSRFALNTNESDSGRLKYAVVETELTLSGQFKVLVKGTVEKVEITVLGEKTFDALKNEIKKLSNAELKHTRADIVCMLMPTPLLSHDHLTVARGYHYEQGFTGALELVDGPSGCWLANQTHPIEAYDLTAAKVLKGQLKVLALETLDL
jgi:hypothetical protein